MSRRFEDSIAPELVFLMGFVVVPSFLLDRSLASKVAKAVLYLLLTRLRGKGTSWRPVLFFFAARCF